jgi:hypothetical protein
VEGTHWSQHGEQESATPPVNNRDLLGQPQNPMPDNIQVVVPPALQQHQRPTLTTTIRTIRNTEYPGDPQSYNNNADGIAPRRDISKPLTDLSKLYSDDKLKFRGDKYQYMEIELRVFRERCRMLGLPESEWHQGLSAMLGGDARDYYYENLANQEPLLTFRQMCEAIQTYFDTPQRLIDYSQEWSAISLQRIINENPDKTRLECLELMIMEIRRLQPGVPPTMSKDQQLRDRAYSAVLGIPECDVAIQMNPPTWQGLCSALRTSIATATRSRKSQEQFAQHDDHDYSPEADFKQHFVDRLYAGRGSYRNRGRGGFKGSQRGSGYRNKSYSGVNSRAKKCYVCAKEGCWSNRHIAEEREKAYSDFKKAKQYHVTLDEYHHWLVDYEGVELDSGQSRVEETEQLLLEWEDIYDE